MVRRNRIKKLMPLPDPDINNVLESQFSEASDEFLVPNESNLYTDADNSCLDEHFVSNVSVVYNHTEERGPNSARVFQNRRPNAIKMDVEENFEQDDELKMLNLQVLNISSIHNSFNFKGPKNERKTPNLLSD